MLLPSHSELQNQYNSAEKGEGWWILAGSRDVYKIIFNLPPTFPAVTTALQYLLFVMATLTQSWCWQWRRGNVLFRFSKTCSACIIIFCWGYFCTNCSPRIIIRTWWPQFCALLWTISPIYQVFCIPNCVRSNKTNISTPPTHHLDMVGARAR